MQNSDDLLKRGAEFIECPKCSRPVKATRQGTQDYCDVYLCKEGHLTNIKVGVPRKEWKETVNDENSQSTRSTEGEGSRD